MIIVIDRKRCTGCGKCVLVCPGGLMKQEKDGTAVMKYPKDCWGCASCIKECKFGAIALYLGTAWRKRWKDDRIRKREFFDLEGEKNRWDNRRDCC